MDGLYLLCILDNAAKSQAVLFPKQVMSNGFLRIHPVRREDEGNYTCTVKNQFGTASSQGRLVVLRESASRVSVSCFPCLMLLALSQ